MTFHELISLKDPNLDPNTIKPLALAYLGDTIFDVYVRSLLVASGQQDAHKLHEKATKLVNAASQARLMRMLLDKLTEEEMTVYKHGRNQHPYSLPKNQSPVDYKTATGLEALLGYLYLNNREDRVIELLNYGLNLISSEETTYE